MPGGLPGQPPDLLFEDISPEGDLPFGFGGGESEEGDARAWPGQGQSQVKASNIRGSARKARAAGPPVERVPAPFADDRLPMVDPRVLPRDQLIWAAGRAAVIGLSDAAFWRGMGAAVAAIGEADLRPSEACRLMQAYAYAPKTAPLDDEQLQRLLKAFARRSRQYSDERLMRFIYGYSKLASKRGLKSQKFLDFTTSEVLERAKKLRGWRKTRILQAVWRLSGTDGDFRNVLVGQVMRNVANLDAERFGIFVPMVVELNYHKRAGVIDKLNTVYKKKLRGWQSPELLLTSGLPMLLHDIMKTGTLIAWLTRLYELRAAPLSPPPAPGTERVRRSTGGSSAEERTPHDGPAHGRPLRNQCRYTEGLESLKLAELCLRHERPAVYARLPPKALHLMEAARNASLEPPDHHEMMELPFVLAEVVRLFRALGFLLHPTIAGPYLLETSQL